MIIKTSISGDWVEVYVAGECVFKGHSMCPSDWAELLRDHYGLIIMEEEMEDEE